MDPLTVEAALAEARTAGVTARLVVGLLPAGRNYLLGLTTSDLEPRLELVQGRGPGRRVDLLVDRHSSGPDRWDYRLRLDELREVYLVRLTRGETVRDVSLVSAAAALTREHGWNDEAFGKLTEPLVGFYEFRRALHEILEAPR